MLCDLLVIMLGENVVNIVDVELVSELFKCFDIVVMFIGVLSLEVYEVLVEVMNSIGGNLNFGEGGEDLVCYGINKVLCIKQVVFGCFGVILVYLVNVDVIQIKVVQGVKLGEGGQLLGDKVMFYIVKLCYLVFGVMLIFLLLYYDIYFIEDLVQFIFDFKQVNLKVMIFVKLVFELGVGIIVIGVVKVYVDLIIIVGYDGGIGVSLFLLVKYVGCLWELGFVEIQQVLVVNGLCYKICLQVDGGLKMGVDIIKVVIFGVESFGFGIGLMVVFGCKYLCICYLNNCVTGVAIQDDKLCKNYYYGLLFKVMNYFEFIVCEICELMVQFGVICLVDLIGCIDLLKELDGFIVKQQKLVLLKLLEIVELYLGKVFYCIENNLLFDNGLLNVQLL